MGVIAIGEALQQVARRKAHSIRDSSRLCARVLRGNRYAAGIASGRTLAAALDTRLGAAAVDYLFEGKKGILVGMQGAEITATSFSEIVGKQKPLNAGLFRLAQSLAK